MGRWASSTPAEGPEFQLVPWRRTKKWRAVIRSALHHPTGRNGRDGTRDLWIVYQRRRLSRRIKNVALAQMTFSHQCVLTAQCHAGPPPQHSPITSPSAWAGDAAEDERRNYSFWWFQMALGQSCIITFHSEEMWVNFNCVILKSALWGKHETPQ